jgi:Uma2 family endonuclease
MVAAPQPNPIRMTEAEYLAFEDSTEERHEYSRGRVYAMTGGSYRHSVITLNIGGELRSQLAGKDCTPSSPDLKIYVSKKKTYRYPDASVVCGDPIFVEGRTDVITNPVVLIEVLSPSTASIDAVDKLDDYTRIESLHTYLLVSQDAPKIQRFVRHESSQWLYTFVTGLDSQIDVPPLDCTLALSEVYLKVRWDETDDDLS